MKNHKIQVTSIKFGFTLVELLIVMAIIAILAGISIFALQGARTSARDARRKSDLEAISAAIEVYRADCDEYPIGGSLPSPLQRNCTGTMNTYMETIPTDPGGGGYYYWSDGAKYRICAALEDPPIPVMACSGCATCNYRKGSP